MSTSSLVKRTRKSLGIIQPELAILIGVHPLTVSKWERGLLEPNTYQQALLRALNAGSISAHDIDVSGWIETKGPIETMAYLLNCAYRYAAPPLSAKRLAAFMKAAQI